MKPDLHNWRCMCGEVNNPADHLTCNKCGKPRWKQLGFSREDSLEVLSAIQPSIKPTEIR